MLVDSQRGLLSPASGAQLLHAWQILTRRLSFTSVCTKSTVASARRLWAPGEELCCMTALPSSLTNICKHSCWLHTLLRFRWLARQELHCR